MLNKLDLHGVKHIDVPKEVDSFVGTHLQKGTREVSIIIGHSDKMKQIVDETLEDYGMKSEYHFLTPTVILVKLF